MKEKSKKIFETISCNICGGNDYSIVYPAMSGREKDLDLVKKFRASGDELLVDQVVKCKRCGLQFINPRLKPEIIIQSYSEGSDEIFISQAKAREATFFNSLKKIEKFAPNKGRVLDIGTAGGSFLAAAKRRGWEVYGCEPNKWMAGWGKKNYGINIQKGTVFQQKYKKNFFDMVTLWDVIEHTPDPSKVLKECSRLLKNSGILVVNYPDIGSWLARLLKRKWLFLTSVHLYYFTPRTMNLLLQKNGFRILKIKPHFQDLEIGYLFFRAGSFSKIVSKLGQAIVKFFNLEHKQVPYWLGQTFVIARKVKEAE